MQLPRERSSRLLIRDQGRLPGDEFPNDEVIEAADENLTISQSASQIGVAIPDARPAIEGDRQDGRRLGGLPEGSQ